MVQAESIKPLPRRAEDVRWEIQPPPRHQPSDPQPSVSLSLASLFPRLVSVGPLSEHSPPSALEMTAEERRRMNRHRFRRRTDPRQPPPQPREWPPTQPPMRVSLAISLPCRTPEGRDSPQTNPVVGPSPPRKKRRRLRRRNRSPSPPTPHQQRGMSFNTPGTASPRMAAPPPTQASADRGHQTCTTQIRKPFSPHGPLPPPDDIPPSTRAAARNNYPLVHRSELPRTHPLSGKKEAEHHPPEMGGGGGWSSLTPLSPPLLQTTRLARRPARIWNRKSGNTVGNN